jgi:D-glycero-alpha-D-manno-heptose-7-phosphate kinase
MIVTRTPLRVSLFGGGSDIPEFWHHHSGSVLSFTIDKYIHIALQSVTPKHVKVMYSKVEQVWDVAKLQHDLFKACLQRYNVLEGVEIASFSDIPTKGSGLGSSSTFTVGLLNALNAYNRETITTDKLAALACEVEIVNCHRRIGHQDAYAAAFGGGNLFKFHLLSIMLRGVSWTRICSLSIRERREIRIEFLLPR